MALPQRQPDPLNTAPREPRARAARRGPTGTPLTGGGGERRRTAGAAPTREVYRSHGELFDGASGRRLCVHDLIADLRDGGRFRVTDASTGRDLTLDTLLQAVSLGVDRLGTWLDQIQRNLLGDPSRHHHCPQDTSAAPKPCCGAPESDSDARPAPGRTAESSPTAFASRPFPGQRA